MAGYRLSYQGETIYIDPYLSRVPLSSVLRRAPAVADPSLHERILKPASGRVAGVLVGHTHFDHAIDVPAIARRYECSRVWLELAGQPDAALTGLGDRPSRSSLTAAMSSGRSP